ncbi:MAG: CapA family protein [Verrucomicrobia bacterium]|nr:CapA family protein [Verrucomicrobiota bacterium]
MTPISPPISDRLTLCLTGDVMTGRGVDQILPNPGDPEIHESHVRDARDYVRLAESENGPIPAPVDFAYVWGDALAAFRRADVRIVNLETSITRHARPWPGKGIQYRMHPLNAGVLTAARIDCCSLANNHLLDWNREGLLETIETLDRIGVHHAGAGRSAAEATAVTVLEVPGKGRVLVLAVGSESSGIPRSWRATPTTSGVNLLDELSPATAAPIAHELLRLTKRGDVTVVSIHWGDNWGYDIPAKHIAFARKLADEGIDIVHGHSSHHVKAIELRRNGVILYGCGDFLTDYEGIGGHEEFRGTLAAAFLVSVALDPRRIARVELVPFHLRRMRMNVPAEADVRWLHERVGRECARFGSQVIAQPDHSLVVRPRP